ncbi:26S protease regulatory subunit 8-like protein B-like [Cucumis melo var. makuwa]|uniref:26S protease regulatory subunit 8-like protein B-like n=1 Tax=Cucumis melo var. makuwa TaxID=1194695 RepID=A0A5D3CAU9_CUCMM|nr:26S protease regulatory subunit 8-like protein B-like [Cucumis melo var. makuwa]TYK07476.1 26S protease regulatory subunit 8-like protein B-like [Cucumis melo var. makuwa]
MNPIRGIDLKGIAKKMNGASGAEVKTLCTEVGMAALRERRVHVTQEDFEMAIAKVFWVKDGNMFSSKYTKSHIASTCPSLGPPRNGGSVLGIDMKKGSSCALRFKGINCLCVMNLPKKKIKVPHVHCDSRND